jgi:hypothetical protein
MVESFGHPKKRNHNNEGIAIGIYIECNCMTQKSRKPGNSKFTALAFIFSVCLRKINSSHDWKQSMQDG